MNKVRYEEYRYSDKIHPFTILPDIQRSQIKYTEEANWHSALEIEFYKQGAAKLLLDGASIDVKENEIAIVSPFKIHKIIPSSKIIYTCLIINLEFCKQIKIDPTKLLFPNILKDCEIIKKINILEEIHNDPSEKFKIAKEYQIIVELLIELATKYGSVLSEPVSNIYDVEIVRRVIAYIQENYEKKISLQELEKKVNINKFSLSKIFKNHTKQTIIEYINTYRCKIAAQMILNGKNVSEAAIECGFNNMSFFTKTFKKIYKTIPSKIKQDSQSLQYGNH